MSTEPNFFDQYDEEAAPADEGGNFFDQFDEDQAGQYAQDRERAAAELRQSQQKLATEQAGGFWIEGPRRALVENPRQLFTALAETAGVADPGSTAEYSDKMLARRYAATGGEGAKEAAADMSETLILSIPGVSMLRGAGFLKGLNLFKDPTTFFKGLLHGVRGGATAGAIGQGATEGDFVQAADVLASRFTGMMWGGGLGAAGSVANIPGAVRNTIARGIRASEKNRETMEALKNSWFRPEDYTVSQRTGNTLARNLEVQVAATRAQNFFNAQFIRFGDAASAYAAGLRDMVRNPQSATSQQIALRIQKSYIAEKDAAFTSANNTYGARLSKAQLHAAADPEAFPLPYGNYQQASAKWNAQTGGAWWRKQNPGAEGWSPELQGVAEYMDEIDKMNLAAARNGGPPQGLSVDQMIRMRAALNKADAGYYRAKHSPGGIPEKLVNEHRMVSELRSSIDRDLDEFLEANMPKGTPRPGEVIPEPRGAVKAIQEMREANADYKAFRDAAEEVDQYAVTQAFGFRVPQDPEKALVDIAGREADQQQFLVDLLRKHDPESLYNLQVMYVERALKATTRMGGPAVGGKVDPEGWLKALTNETGAPLGERIFTPGQKAEIERGMNTVRLLLNGPVVEGRSVASVGRAPEVQGITMALASWSNAFLSRYGVRIAGLPAIERLLFTELGLKEIETLRPVIQAWSAGRLTQGVINDHRDAVNILAKWQSNAMAPEATE